MVHIFCHKVQQLMQQTERGHSESNQKIVSHNLLCLQLKGIQFGRSWLRISIVASFLQHQKTSIISQVNQLSIGKTYNILQQLLTKQKVLLCCSETGPFFHSDMQKFSLQEQHPRINAQNKKEQKRLNTKKAFLWLIT